MTQGKYRRCSKHGCRKKAAPDTNFCGDHYGAEMEQLMKANPALTRMIQYMVTRELSCHEVGYHS